MQVYQTDSDGFFIYPVSADRDPLVEDNWLIPRGCITTKPPELKEGQKAKWTGKAWTIVEPDPEVQVEPVDPSEEVRSKRNYKLTKSDWTQVADAPVDKTAWAEYRQKLRDIPQQSGFPTEVDWPVKPHAPTS